MHQTLKQFAVTCDRDIYEEDHDVLVGWLMAIEEAIDDGDEVSEENLESWNTKPKVWAVTGFESNVDIKSDPRGVAVWANVNAKHLTEELKAARVRAEGVAQFEKDTKEFGPRPGFNRGAMFGKRGE